MVRTIQVSIRHSITIYILSYKNYVLADPVANIIQSYKISAPVLLPRWKSFH